MPTFVYMTRCDGCGHCVDICPSDIMHIDMGQEAAQESTELRFLIAVRDSAHRIERSVASSTSGSVGRTSTRPAPRRGTPGRSSAWSVSVSPAASALARSAASNE